LVKAAGSMAMRLHRKAREEFRMSPMQGVEQDRYAVILAGGDASRLMPLSRRITGRPVPKQFCPIIGGHSLLAQTRRRIAHRFSPKRTLIVLTRHHEEFYGNQVRDVPPSNLIIQPDNRGTAAAIFYAMMRLAKLDPDSVAAVFPSDHYVSDDRRFMLHMELAIEMAQVRPAQLALVGIKPDRAETEFGWIEPGERLGQSKLFTVRRFWEKPSNTLADRLWKQGCLWNSFMMAGTVRSFLTSTARALPELKRAFAFAWPALETPREALAIDGVYAQLPSRDFSREVLARSARSLMVMPVEDVYWNDLGDSRRVHETLARAQVRPGWLTQRPRRNRNDFVRRVLPRLSSLQRRAKGAQL
jgi:mannose-1-phosphate guanylyltransferase